MSDELPKAVAEATFRIFGVDVKCFILDNGKRIIEADSFNALIDAMADHGGREAHDLDAFTEWLNGKQPG